MKRTLTSLAGNSQKLDGGAMFGNVPKTLWDRWTPADDRNRIDLACRCLLIEEPERRVLLETGIGAFFDPKLADRYGVQEPEHVLLQSLAALGLTHQDIDVVVLSHLHFDHAGGLLSAYQEGQEPDLLFPNARFVVGEKAWQRAIAPHQRDRASFIPRIQALLQASGRLERVDGVRSEVLGPDYHLHRSDGHTPGLMLTEVATSEGPLLFAADLIPGTPWVHTAITMGYDRFPELLIEEKQSLLTNLHARRGRLFFTHDPKVSVARVAQDSKGRFVPSDTLPSLERIPG
ncbi:MAG: glyoxylase-like metal-dependent hydrolase (beta-lactamase superfamily II) [Cognaticolwellia sp.]|jgi:glyoxylase-like metal-dependent hydrolase (beta-lactamase superfamily II)